MSSNRGRRVAKEIADIHQDKHSRVSATPVGNDDIMHLKGTFQGPPGTAYEGGTYTIDIKIPQDYPFKPPVMRFDTKVWHPNVSSQTVSYHNLHQINGWGEGFGGATLPCSTHPVALR
jgi:ubiquitin-conjugating enzyme (huntingtin interacting protein 2)